MRVMVIGQSLRMESHTANPARKVTVCSQMGTEYPETQVSGDTRARETMALLCPTGCFSWRSFHGHSGQSLLPPDGLERGFYPTRRSKPDFALVGEAYWIFVWGKGSMVFHHGNTYPACMLSALSSTTRIAGQETEKSVLYLTNGGTRR